MTDFLTRAEADHLAEQLAHVSDLEQEMAIALTGDMSPRGDGHRAGKPGSRPPYPLHIEHLLDALKNELVGAVRAIIENRGIEPPASDTLSGCAKWLTRYRFALTLMEEGVEIFRGLCATIDRCRDTMGHREPEPYIDQARVEEANRQVVTRSDIDRLAPKLGEVGKGLTSRRVRHLEKQGHLEPAGADGEVKFYRLGDVLRAHQQHPRRNTTPCVTPA